MITNNNCRTGLRDVFFALPGALSNRIEHRNQDSGADIEGGVCPKGFASRRSVSNLLALHGPNLIAKARDHRVGEPALLEKS